MSSFATDDGKDNGSKKNADHVFVPPAKSSLKKRTHAALLGSTGDLPKRPRRSSSSEEKDRHRSVSFEHIAAPQGMERSVSVGSFAGFPDVRRRRRLSSATFSTPHVLAPWLAAESAAANSSSAQGGLTGRGNSDGAVPARKPRLSVARGRIPSRGSLFRTSSSFDFLPDAQFQVDTSIGEADGFFGSMGGRQPPQQSIVNSPSTTGNGLQRAYSAPVSSSPHKRSLVAHQPAPDVDVSSPKLPESQELMERMDQTKMLREESQSPPEGEGHAGTAAAAAAASPAPGPAEIQKAPPPEHDSVPDEEGGPDEDDPDEEDDVAAKLLREAEEEVRAVEVARNAEEARKKNKPESSPSFDADIEMLLAKPFDDWYIGERYEPDRVIGKGSYGQVMAAKDLLTGEKVAIKRIKGLFDNYGDARRILREISILRELRHKNVIQIMDIIRPPDLDRFNELYIVFAMRDTDMMKLIGDQSQTLTSAHVVFFMAQLLRGLQYMHNCRVLHRDLKPANILLTETCQLSICDFGLARPMVGYNVANGAADGQGSAGAGNSSGTKQSAAAPPSPAVEHKPPPKYRRQLTQHVATRWYRAPELILRCNYDAAIDLWSAGCIMAEMLTMMGSGARDPLFPGGPCEFSPTGDIPAHQRLDQLETIFEVVGSPAKATIDAMLSGSRFKSKMGAKLQEKIRTKIKDKEVKPERSLAQRFKEAPPEAIDLLTKLLQFNPANRITIDEALAHPYLAPYLNEFNEETQRGKVIDFSFETEARNIPNIRKFIVEEILWYENVWRPQVEKAEYTEIEEA